MWGGRVERGLSTVRPRRASRPPLAPPETRRLRRMGRPRAALSASSWLFARPTLRLLRRRLLLLLRRRRLRRRRPPRRPRPPRRRRPPPRRPLPRRLATRRAAAPHTARP